MENAVQTAVNDCIRDGILSEYLTAHKAEVIGMCITEYDEQETMYAFKEEGRQEGLQALVNSLKKFITDINLLYKEVISNEGFEDVTLEQVKKYY